MGNSVKRAFDLCVAVPMMLLALPICAVLLILVRLDSAGPALFRQTRLGRDRRPFTIYKIRTMSQETRDGASHEIGTASVTRIGSALRRFKLDELPQLFNVVSGSMSFVGPRPCLPSQEELIAERDSRNLFSMRPGITGPAQVAGIDMSTPRLLAETEAGYYFDGESGLASDFGLLVRTFFGGGRGDAAVSTRGGEGS